MVNKPTKSTIVDGQTDFSGGMITERDADGTQYRFGSNIVIRNGPATRGGIRRAFRVNQAGFNEAFSFDGFWFPFSFIGSAWGDIQGVGFVQFATDTTTQTVVVSGGRVFVHKQGFVEDVSTSDSIATDEVIEFVQANQYLFMLRGESNDVLYWDGSSSGFVAVPDGAINDIPQSQRGAYTSGRLLLVNGDDVYASGVLDFADWDYAYRKFGINRGDGDEIMSLVPFNNDFVLVFKKRATYALIGLSATVMAGSQLSDYVSVQTLSSTVGCIAPKCVVAHGEQVTFLSYKGITSIARNEQGNIMGRDDSMSAPIESYIKRINWGYADKSCAGFHDNYLYFGLPLDEATTPNTIIVYDILANKGKGAWVGEWTGRTINPLEFFSIDEKAYFLGSDGAMREMFTNDPWDSEDPYDDAPLYDSSTLYSESTIVYYPVDGEKRLYQADVETIGNIPTDSDYWTRVEDVQGVYAIKSKLKTRFFKHGDPASPKRWGRTEVEFEHQNPNVSVSIEGEDYGTEKEIYANQEYSQVEYDVAGYADWDDTNINLDYADPYRKDYTPYLSSGGVDGSLITNGDFQANEWDEDDWGGTPDKIVNNGDSITIQFFQGSVTYIQQDFDTILGQTYTVTVAMGGSDSTKYLDVFAGTVVASGQTWEQVSAYQGATTSLEFTATGTTSRVWVRNNQGLSGPSTGVKLIVLSISCSLSSPSLCMDSNGLDLNIYESHSLRFIPRLVDNKRYSVIFENERGKFRLRHIVSLAQLSKFANKGR